MATDRLTPGVDDDEEDEDKDCTTTSPPAGERPTLQRSQSAKKSRNKKNDVKVLSTSMSASGGQSSSAALYRHLRPRRSTAICVLGVLPPSAPSALYRHLRQHRNSWPTIDAAATTAAAKTIVSSPCYEITTQFRGINITKRKRTYFTNYIVGVDVKVKKILLYGDRHRRR